MNRNIEELLKPTLTDNSEKTPIFSPRASFFTAFFGGPLAITMLSVMNSNKLKRLNRDMTYYLLAVVGCFIYLYIILDFPEGGNISDWARTQRRENMFYRYGSRALALVYWAAFYCLHKQYHKTMDIFDMVSPNPWKAAIASVLLGGLCQYLLAILVLFIRGAL